MSNNSFDYVKMISDALIKKSKTVFGDPRNGDVITKLAQFISPAYRDFIYKVISNSALKFSYSSSPSIEPIESGMNLNTTKLTKKVSNRIFTTVFSKDGLTHELGHSVDFTFGISNALSSRVIVKNNQTLYEIFTQEFESTYQDIYNQVMAEYKQIIDSSIGNGAFDLLIKYMPTYKKLSSIRVSYSQDERRKQRHMLQDELYKCGFVETYYQFCKKKCYQPISLKYGPVIDALSAKFDFKGLRIPCHDKEYYERNEYRHVFEFFANCFEAKVTCKQWEFDSLKKFLPKSFEAFERLFAIYYDHIQNNKKFIDLKLKGVDYKHE